jgi:hypothetical protein
MRPVLSIASAAGIALAALAAAAAPAFAAPPPTLISDDGGGKGHDGGGGGHDGGGGGDDGGGRGGGRGGGPDVRLSPSTVHPGDTVIVRIDCSAYSSPAPTWRSADAFDGPVDLQPMNGQPGFFSGSGIISSALHSGDYKVTGACAARDDNSRFEGRLTIRATGDDGGGRGRGGGGGGDGGRGGGGDGGGGGGGDGGRGGDGGGGWTGPRGAARTGLGGSITGGDATQVALGAALVAGAGGLVLRRRHSNDGD